MSHTIGYARVSATDQNLDAQLEQLQAVGADKIFKEKISGVKRGRPQLTEMLNYVREGDSVVRQGGGGGQFFQRTSTFHGACRSPNRCPGCPRAGPSTSGARPHVRQES